jgi:hypothetical protein
LAPLSRILATKADAEHARGRVREILGSLAQDPAARELFAREQYRQVDISLQRLDEGLGSKRGDKRPID